MLRILVTKVLQMKLKDLRPLKDNPFKSTGDEQIKQIGQSIQEFEKMLSIRKIVIDENNEIIGGNKRFFALKALGYTEIPDGWIDKQTDLTDEEKRRFIVTDNAHYGSFWDYETLMKWNVPATWGVDIEFADDMEDIDSEELGDAYTSKVDSPIYEPREEQPDINDLYDTGKYKELIKNIKKSSISKHIKDFLIAAASRHIEFNYAYIADYYAHSDKKTQKLMEDSALIIIDFEKAIEQGYVKLKEEAAKHYLEEHGK